MAAKLCRLAPPWAAPKKAAAMICALPNEGEGENSIQLRSRSTAGEGQLRCSFSVTSAEETQP
eukprot:5079521-Prorocentrum_lima.AAC.1